MLPSAQRIPPIGDLFTQQSTSPVPKQGTLAAVGAHEAWIACLVACEELPAAAEKNYRLGLQELDALYAVPAREQTVTEVTVLKCGPPP